MTEPLRAPFPKSWWVDAGKLLAGGYPGATEPLEADRKLRSLLDAGIRCVISLQEPNELGRDGKPFVPYVDRLNEFAVERSIKVEHRSFPIADTGVPTHSAMRKILAAIDVSLCAKRPVYVHCWGGHGRTATVVGCWLITSRALTGEEAVTRISKLRQHDPLLRNEPAPQENEQEQIIRHWPCRYEAARRSEKGSSMVPQQNNAATRDRFRGCLLGLAVGDAVGTTLEFSTPDMFDPIDDMVGGGPFDLEPGQWTDDTSMALCLAESLIERGRFDPIDQLQRYCRWWRKGHLSCTGKCFDIGTTVRSALHNFEVCGESYCGATDERTAGNGSIMRLAPIPMAFASDPERAIEFAALSSRTTHQATPAVDACRYLAALLVGAFRGAKKETLLSERYCPINGYWDADPLCPEIDDVACGSFKGRQPPRIVGSGYVVRCLEAALWAFDQTDHFRDGCLLAANLGNDADTTAAVYGQLAGAYYGATAIPSHWRNRLALVISIESIADHLSVLMRTIAS